MRRTLFAICTVFFSACATAAFADDPANCGSLHVKANGVALSNNGQPAHTQSLDQTWTIPAGPYNHYVNPDGTIITQGYPSNGGSESWESLKTTCTVTPQGTNPPTLALNLTASSHLNSGVGPGTGASADFDSEWFSVAMLPSTEAGKSWTLNVIGVINASNVTPTCAIKLNNDPPKKLATGPFIQTFPNLSGAIAVFISCSQGHIAVFPSGPHPGGAEISVNSQVTLSFSHT